MPVTAPEDQPARRRGLPSTFVAVCVALGLLVGAYCVLMLVSLTTASTEHRTRTFALTAPQLRVSTDSGDVRVVGERRRDVRVDMEIHRGMFRNGFQPRVATRNNGRRLQLENHCSLMAHVGVGDCGASFTVYVPRGTIVAVNASSADVHVEGLERDVTVAASSGDVHVEDATGTLRATASSGDVHVDGYRGRRVDVDADSGDVHLTAVRTPRELRVVADSGDIDVAVPNAVYSVSVQTDSGDQDVQVRQNPRAPRVIRVKASSGDVTIAPLGDTG